MADADGPVVLRAAGVRKEFAAGGGFGRAGRRTTVAVDGIDLEVHRGETLAIVGESGSGKSTLARMLLGLIPPSAGTIWFEGQNLSELSGRRMREMRRHLQMIFQDPYASLHPRRTTFQIISEGWRIHRGIERRADYRRRVAELLEQVGLPTSYADMYPSRLSGGERQRVAIARALAVRPEVLVLDEPVSALDVSIQAQVIQLLMGLQERLNLTYVFISHDLSLVRLVADRVAVMHHGQIVESGPTSRVYSSPSAEYTRALLAAAPTELVDATAAAAEVAEITPRRSTRKKNDTPDA